MEVEINPIISEVKGALERSIDTIRKYNEHNLRNPGDQRPTDELRDSIYTTFNNFGSYWTVMHAGVKEVLGETEAGVLRNEILVHHHFLTKGRPGYEGGFRFGIGMDITWNEYENIIKAVDPKAEL
jgi:hypothetical protein